MKKRRKRKPIRYTASRGKPWHRPYLETTNWATSYDVTTKLINARQLGQGVELGTGYGWHAEQILLRCPTASVITIDAYRVEVDDMIKKFDGGAYERLCHETIERLQLYAERALFLRMTTEAAARVVDVALDWLYVDASHDYASCLHDLQTWFPKLKRPGGLLMGHDYGQPQHIGVKVAVDEFLAKHELTLGGVEEYVWWVDL